ncbi:mevalonate kinase [Bifidobacterium sp. ESL0790]|uniref:mevalonate kinase n=1 Tax=Bifidobacterium sp. ESL0790 TaxID=2983233 RepID=UPI0023F7E757|nr:mevalonate kinase [Bifidobacterium sp. ESL0790]WEV72331.1 mevalonate kinase [Bifidobacterium sp. ESL0790]
MTAAESALLLDRPKSRGGAVVVPNRDSSALPHKGYGETWAKIILMGEHSVVYGYPAVAVPIRALKMRAWVTPSEGSASTSRGSGDFAANSDEPADWADVAGSVDAAFNSSDSSDLCHIGTLKALNYDGSMADAGARFGGLERAVKVATEFVGHPEQAFDIVTDGAFPAGRGMGSSAASSGAVIRAILDAYDCHPGEREILRLTNEAEVVTHGNPSGLDAATTCSNEAVVFESGEMSTMHVNMPAYLVIADSGIAGSTREAVGGVRQQDERDHTRVKGIMDELGELARDSQTDLERGTVRLLGQRMNEAHKLLHNLKVSHPLVDRLVEAARKAGAVGAKMTGGGLGGCLIALAPTAETANRVRQALLRGGAREAWVHPLEDATVAA